MPCPVPMPAPKEDLLIEDSGSDVPIHLYSFSFNLNPDWTQALADQEEILACQCACDIPLSSNTHRTIDIESTVDKFGLRPHFNFGAECLGAEWQNGKWNVQFKDVSTGKTFTKKCEVFLSAVGGFATLREPRFPGLNQFEGPVFHTADWDHSFDWHGKRVAVIGNGCSAAQVVPSIAPGVKKLTQYARSPQWYHPRPNKVFSRLEKFCFRYLPLWQRWYRLDTFLKTDQLASVYGSDQGQIKQRLALEEEARQYIYSQSPKKYHHFIVPDFPLGCKRRIYDPGYLASLHRDNVELLPEGVRECTKTGIVSSETGQEQDFDAIILATGFDVSSFLAPMKVVGKNGTTIHDQWKDHRGAQAYMGTFVHNFPNLAIMYVPWKTRGERLDLLTTSIDSDPIPSLHSTPSSTLSRYKWHISRMYCSSPFLTGTPISSRSNTSRRSNSSKI